MFTYQIANYFIWLFISESLYLNGEASLPPSLSVFRDDFFTPTFQIQNGDIVIEGIVTDTSKTRVANVHVNKIQDLA